MKQQLTPEDVRRIQRDLAAPFAPDDVSWKPQAVSGNRALAVAYIDARTVMDRLDEVLGIDGWQDMYTATEGGAIQCSLQLWMGHYWVMRQDVGGQSEQEDGGDRLKAAFSDALKRAAVKFGVGRYLYSLPKQWCDFDPNKKQFVSEPKLPAWAVGLSADEKARIEEWRLDLQSSKNADDLNAGAPQIAALSARIKPTVWQAFKSRAAALGLHFDESRKLFVPKENPK